MKLKEAIEKYGLTVKYFKAETCNHFYFSSQETAEEFLKEHHKKYIKLEFTGRYSRDKVPSLLYKVVLRKPKPAYWGVKTNDWPSWSKETDFIAPTLEEALEKAITCIQDKNI